MNAVLLAHCFAHELLTWSVAFVCGAACCWGMSLLRAAWRQNEKVRNATTNCSEPKRSDEA